MLKVQDTRQITDLQMCSAPPPPRCPDQRTSTTVIAIVPPPFSYYFSIVLLFVAKCIMTNLIIKSFPIWVTDLLKLFTIGHLAFGIWLKSLQVSRKLTISAWGVAIPLYYPFDVI